MRRAAALMSLLAFAPAGAGCASYSSKNHEERLAHPDGYPSEGREAPGRGDEPESRIERTEEQVVAETGAAPPTYGSFDDALLITLIERALEASPNVETTLARVRLARAMADQARAARFPVIMASGVATRSSAVQFFGRFDIASIAVSLPISWEIDLYGRFASEHRAAKQLAEASQLDFEAMQISLMASVAEAYFDLVAVRAERKLVDAQLETNRDFLELVTIRFESGLSAALDVHQQRQQVASLEARHDLLEGEEVVSTNALMLVVGVTDAPLDVGSRDTLPTIGEPPPHGVPATLFERRPDLKAAAIRVDALDKRVRAAIVAQLPALRLAITPGYISQRVNSASPVIGGSRTISGFQWTATAALDVAVFDGLLGPATANARRAEVDEAVAAYRQAFQNAIIEVDNSVALDHQQRQAIENLERQVEFADDTLSSARERYQAGFSDFLPVLTALQTKQAAEQALLAAQRNLVLLRLQLFRALGGVIEIED